MLSVGTRWLHVLGAAVLAYLTGLPALADGGLAAQRAEIEAAKITLSDADAERLLDELPDAGPSVNSSEFERAISVLSSDSSVAGMRPLKYANPVIVDVVIQAYIAVVEKEREYAKSIKGTANVQGGSNEVVGPVKSESGESVQESLDALAALAESSLSEKLYEYIWDYPQPSPYRRLYVATVHPEKTLDRIVGATRGRERDGQRFATGYLFSENSVLGVSVHRAFTHMEDIAELHTELVREKREVLIDFIGKYALFYVRDAEGPYVPWRDYVSREAALRILDLIGGHEEISLVQKIAEGAPVLNPSRRIESPRDIRAMSKSIVMNISPGE